MTHPQFRYLQADRVGGDGFRFTDVSIRDHDEQKIGDLDGIIVDPAARRLRFFVVDVGEPRRYLLPVCTLRLDINERALCMMDRFDARRLEAFEPDAFGAFDEQDVLTALFGATPRTV